jgi:hypothetical protein
VLIGVPIGERLIRRMPAETFRRLCMTSMRGGRGASPLSGTFGSDRKLGLSAPAALFSSTWLLYRFFTRSRISTAHTSAPANEDRRTAGDLPVTIGMARIVVRRSPHRGVS